MKLVALDKGAAGNTSTVFRSLLGEDVVYEHDSTIGAEFSRTRARDWQKQKADKSDLQEHLA